MSTFVSEAIHPKTGKSPSALYIDDYYGSHRYGVGFKNDGSDTSLYDIIDRDTYTVYPLEEIKTEPRERHSNNEVI